MLDEVDGVDEVDGSMVGDTTSACSIAVIAVQVGVSMKSSGEIIVDSNIGSVPRSCKVAMHQSFFSNFCDAAVRASGEQ